MKYRNERTGQELTITGVDVKLTDGWVEVPKVEGHWIHTDRENVVGECFTFPMVCGAFNPRMCYCTDGKHGVAEKPKRTRIMTWAEYVKEEAEKEEAKKRDFIMEGWIKSHNEQAILAYNTDQAKITNQRIELTRLNEQVAKLQRGEANRVGQVRNLEERLATAHKNNETHREVDFAAETLTERRRLQIIALRQEINNSEYEVRNLKSQLAKKEPVEYPKGQWFTLTFGNWIPTLAGGAFIYQRNGNKIKFVQSGESLPVLSATSTGLIEALEKAEKVCNSCKYASTFCEGQWVQAINSLNLAKSHALIDEQDVRKDERARILQQLPYFSWSDINERMLMRLEDVKGIIERHHSGESQ